MSRERVPSCPEVFLDGPGYVYAGKSCFIELHGDKPVLDIFGEQFTGTLEDLEVVLYEQFYLPEICEIAAEDYYADVRARGDYEKEKEQ